ncbi:hypothetical protein TEHN7126_2228 [Tetragenococcus halophilus subsp. halophilus]|uniref:hypothetical protein n=1 Tax=Tetragenococcus halophilus TaxID=51669 RepID=UPI000CAAA8BD|nr:hypothetical protein [Tetragenococcus halophilus]GBD74229.1 hypothetical protein TEHN7125_2389 [Tetragenococcus halophilus subsp. halophilus]GBD76529.1 hypothetical protein TEHN7126_2228 [Tetragenococcus halophilus subsp. halophilus]
MSDREKIKRLRIIVEQLAFNHNLDFKMLHASIIALLDMIDDFLKEEELTEEQQEIYESLIELYDYNSRNYLKDDDIIIGTIDAMITNYEIIDKDFIPALKKFLEEVEE